MWLWMGLALAAQVSLDLDTSEVREGQTIGLSLTVADTTVKGVPAVTAPAGVEVSYRSQSQNRLMINFNLTSSTVFRYALTGVKEGDYTLGPVSVDTAAGKLSSPAVKLHVAPRGGSGLNQLTADAGVSTAWVGQLLVYHMRFETERQLVDGRWGPPEGPGVTPEPGIDPVTAENPVADGGAMHVVSELFYPLRVGKPGTLTLPGGIFRGQFAVAGKRRRGGGNSPMDGLFDDLAGMTQVTSETWSAPPLSLTVKELPSDGRPAGFGGLVGNFAITSRVSATSVAVGDTVTIEVEVTGDAPLAGFSLPPLVGDGFRVYDDQPTTEARLVDGRIQAVGHYKRAVVPEVAGAVEIPPVELHWFDPVAGRYTSARTEPLRLDVSGTAADVKVASFAGAQKDEVGALADDILPVRTGGQVAAPWPGRWAWVLLAPGGLALVLQAARGLRLRPRVQETRRYDFSDLPADPEGRLAGLDRIFRERVAARIGVAPAALRREEVAGLGEEAERVFRELERLRYSGASGGLPEDAVRRVVEAL